MSKLRIWGAALISILVMCVVPWSQIIPGLRPASSPIFHIYFLGCPIETWLFWTAVEAVYWGLWWPRNGPDPSDAS